MNNYIYILHIEYNNIFTHHWLASYARKVTCTYIAPCWYASYGKKSYGKMCRGWGHAHGVGWGECVGCVCGGGGEGGREEEYEPSSATS
jgi:hypothetical protein